MVLKSESLDFTNHGKVIIYKSQHVFSYYAYYMYIYLHIYKINKS